MIVPYFTFALPPDYYNCKEIFPTIFQKLNGWKTTRVKHDLILIAVISTEKNFYDEKYPETKSNIPAKMKFQIYKSIVSSNNSQNINHIPKIHLCSILHILGIISFKNIFKG